MENKHEKQQIFYKNTSKIRWIFGGNRTGKTHCGAQEAVWHAVGFHPYKKIINATEGWVVSLSAQVQRDVAQRKVLKLLDTEVVESQKRQDENFISYECVMQSGKAKTPERGIIDFITVYNKFGTESKIGFKNCEQGREKFQGTSLDWVWFDEEPGEDIFDECLIRTLDRSGLMWGTMTPLKGRTWVYERIFLKGNIKQNENSNDGKVFDISLISMSWEDNPFLPREEIKNMERSYSLDTLESRKYGRFIDGTGLVFKEFSEENIIKNVSPLFESGKWIYTGISIDPGYTNPTAVLWFAVDGDGNILVLSEYKEAGKNVPQISKEILNKSKELGIEMNNVFIDSAAAARTLGESRSVAEQFRACGIHVNTNVDKNVLEGLHRVKALFCSASGERKLFVYENCVHLIKELRSYFWGDNERPIARNDHCIDALRYFVMSACEPRCKAKINELGKFKRRLQNENNK